MTTSTLFDWRAERDAALAQVATAAGPAFRELAEAFVLVLLEGGPKTGEQLTDACKARGIVPETTDRAFGPVYMSLSRQGLIEKCGPAVRTKGHLTSGGNWWKLSTPQNP